MFDVITFGSATWDVFMNLSPKHIKRDSHMITGTSLRFNMGSKIDIPEMYFAFGGGGVNTATTFIRQGFQTAYCGMVGDDIPGREIVEHLKHLGIDTSLIYKTSSRATNNSVILNAPGLDRVVLAYRGASELLDQSLINWDKLQARAIYLAPLSGSLCRLTEKITAHAKKSHTLVAANLGNSQLKMGRSCLKSLLARVDILILNQEEAAIFTGINYQNEKKIITEMARLHSGINIITKGKEGAIIIAQGILYSGKTKSIKVINATGAGDAFGSGFVSGMLASNNIEYSIKLALINSKRCLTEKGVAKFLAKEDNFLIDQENLKIKKTQLN